MKEKKLLKIPWQSLPKVLSVTVQAILRAYITAAYTRAKRRWHGATAHAPPRNEGQRLSLGPYRVPVQCAAIRPYLRP
jgi:hypothetical protein